MKSFNSILNESWKNYREKYRQTISNMPLGFEGGTPQENREIIAKNNKRSVRVDRSKNAFPDDKSIVGNRPYYKSLFRGAILRGETPGPGFDQTRFAPNRQLNRAEFLDNQEIKYDLGTKTSEMARERDRIRFQAIKQRIMSYHVGRDADPTGSPVHNKLVKLMKNMSARVRKSGVTPAYDRKGDRIF